MLMRVASMALYATDAAIAVREGGVVC